MSNYPMQDPNQPPYSEQYGAPNYYPPQQPPNPPQPPAYPPQPPAYPPQPTLNYPAPDAGWNAPSSYPPAPGYPQPQYPLPGYPDANQPYAQAGYTQPAPGYADPVPYGQPNPNYANPSYANPNYANPAYGQSYPNYYAAPPVTRKRHTGRNIAIGLVVFIVIIGAVIGLVALQHKSNTAQTGSGSNYPSYLPGHGTLMLNDSLQSAGNWVNTGDGHCAFDTNSFHVRTLSKQEEYSCWSQTQALSNVSNSAFEAQMKIVQGDCGGLDMRVAESSFSGHHKFYLFSVCEDGNYAIFKYNVNALGVVTVLDFTHSTAIKQGLNATNTLDVVTRGSTLMLFINGQQMANVQDTSLTAGTFGLAANPGRNDVTDVSYTDAKAWTL